MPTTHTWKGASGTYLYDPTQYADDMPFAAGDTLVVSSGDPTVVSTTSSLFPLVIGTYEFTPPGGGLANLSSLNVELEAASTLGAAGAGTVQWFLFDQFVNAGTIQVGSPTTSATVQGMLSTTYAVTFTNQGSILVQDGSLFRLQPSVADSTLVNAADATLSVSGGSTLSLSSNNGYIATGGGNLNTTNNGVIEVTGASGRTTSADFEGSYEGSGVLSVRGAPGATASTTSIQIGGAASGIFDVASGELQFDTTPVGGFVNFRDNDAALVLDRGASTSYNAPGYPFGATIYGFQAGDSINLIGSVPATTYNYNPSSHVLTITVADGSSLGQFTFAGNYQQSDFKITPVGAGGVGGLNITTTSTANAIPGFTYTDTTTHGVGSQGGQQYTGPVSYLQSQFIWPTTQDSADVTARLPDVFLKGGAGNDALAADSGSNVLDGSLGSNFLVGASGADGGTDTFFLDGRSGTTWDTLVNFHPGDAMTLWGYVPGQSMMSWAASDGAPGYQGATVHASLADAGTPVNGSVTFAGVSLADAQSKLTTSSGIASGLSYLYVKYTG